MKQKGKGNDMCENGKPCGAMTAKKPLGLWLADSLIGLFVLLLVVIGLVAAFGCGDAERQGETTLDDEVSYGTSEQPWTFRPSASGGRTWGTDASGVACTKTGAANAQCKWVGNVGQGGEAEQIIKVCVKPTFDSTDFPIITAAVDVWASSMHSFSDGGTVPRSFSRVVPSDGGSDCGTSGANITIIPGVTTAPFGSTYRQYATESFSNCLQLLEQPNAVNGSYSSCSLASINVALSQMRVRMGNLGFTAAQKANAQEELIMHVLDAAIGFGSQTTNTTVVTNPTFNTSSKDFLSNEEICRMNKMSIGAFSSNLKVAFSTTTCPN